MKESKLLTALLLMTISMVSCNSIRKTFSANKPPHEVYANSLNAAGLQQTQLGKLWFSAAANALQQPVGINLPYMEKGFFDPAIPGAAGFSFKLNRGDQLIVVANSNPSSNLKLFCELWQQTNDEKKLLASADTVTNQLRLDCKSTGEYIIRLQAELLQALEYSISISTAPSLAFPVDHSGNPKIISTWGVGRDNGTRQHEGIDIAATYATPVLAVADGYVSRVTENNLGGNVIFLNPYEKDFSVYYAHLSKQIAVSGQQVKAGDTLGLVGNTGNAKNTVPHLHFGIYSKGGAIDPQPFVDTRRPSIKQVTADSAAINTSARLTESTTLKDAIPASTSNAKLEKNQLVTILAAAGSYYRVRLPDQQIGYINSKAVTAKPFQQRVLKDSINLLNDPNQAAPVKAGLASGTTIQIAGVNQGFYFVQSGNLEGWIQRSKL